jgi:hypothetical protein
MKFLGKNKDSKILNQSLVYKENKPKNNKKLLELLIHEQKNFCAYTEKYLEELDATEVEHFNSDIKYKDNYFNYYAVTRKANLYKKDEKYKDSTFFKTLFFQNNKELKSRIKFIDNIYFEINENDTEAKELIDFLGFNNPILSKQRKRHVERLRECFKKGNYSKEEIINHFLNHNQELSFITAIEAELDLKLDYLIEKGAKSDRF